MLRLAVYLTAALCVFAGEFQTPYFEANQGQFAPEARFLARQGRHSLFITEKGAVSVLDGKSVLRMNLRGGQRALAVAGESPTVGRSNYLVGEERNWIKDVPHYSRVVLREVYPAIDLAYYTAGRELEYDFIVRPGATRRGSGSSSAGRGRRLRSRAI